VWADSAGDSLDVLRQETIPRILEFNLGRLRSFADRALFAGQTLQELWRRNEDRREPTFVVVDEAHHVAPALAEFPWQKTTVEWINRFAGEGRKYGLFLILASQRPAKIHSNTLDNCSNHIIMRLQNQDDLDSLSRGTAVVSMELLSRASAFRPHEALVFGRMTAPAVVRVGRRRMDGV
jgi:DNA helicase HerA-like ATPase